MNWLKLPQHRSWLQAECEGLLAFGCATAVEGRGALWLDVAGLPDPTRPAYSWITARMVHVYALGHLMGIPGSRPIAERALSGLLGPLRDATHGGWFHDDTRQGPKFGYDHAFVVLAASSATHACLNGARELLDEALSVVEARFWDETAGLIVDLVASDFSAVDEYRGINANMHCVEAFLAAADATGEPIWVERAARIAAFARAQAQANGWRLPEHYSPDWRPLPEFNADRVDDQFRPYGATPGHGLEWARLLLHVEAALGADEPAWVDAARALYDRAVDDGWDEGFCYTTNWQGEPVVADRFHWVAAEAVCAAAALARRTGEERFAYDYTRWWDNIAAHFIDPELGSWFHQLTPANEPTDTVWPGKPDLYHAVQATLIPRLPLAPQLAKAIAAGWLAG